MTEPTVPRRGDVWTVSGAGYAGKPRPAVIVQDDVFAATESVTVCSLTTTESSTPMVRPLITPHADNGLKEPSRVMADKVTTTQRKQLGRRIGSLSAQDMEHVDQALTLFLGLVR
jgi:mRNA interferase MazF